MAVHCHLETKLNWENHLSSSTKGRFKQINTSQTIHLNQTVQRNLTKEIFPTFIFDNGSAFFYIMISRKSALVPIFNGS